jgi:anti-sigma B factor antagonist
VEQSESEQEEPLRLSATEVAGEDPYVRLDVAGELDIAGADSLEQRIEALLASGATVELDLSELTFVDSTGLAVLVRQSLGAANEGHRFRIARGELSEQVRHLIELTGTTQVLWP